MGGPRDDDLRVIPLDVPRETSSATTRLVLGYVRAHHGDDGVQRVLEAAAVPHALHELEDASRWVSYDARIRLFEAACAELADPRAMFAVGASVIAQAISPSLVLLLRALGSPAQVYRQLPRSVAKFSTTSTMSVVEADSASATVRFRLHEGYRHSRLDCDYAQGLISTVPVVFGLPAAHVVHETCQGEGHPACLYHVTWSRRHRWSRGRRADDLELVALRQQLFDLQSASSELVGTGEIADVLERITKRAASSVLAAGYLLAVVPADGGEPLVQSVGVPATEVDRLATALLAGDDLGPGAVVVDVASARRHHGRLAALFGDGQVAAHDERRLLAAYAGHAAAALDMLSALDASRRDAARAQTLLTLSHRLAAAVTTEDVAGVVSTALRVVVGCDHAGLLLWDPTEGVLRTSASSGLEGKQQAALMDAILRPQDVPELTAMVTSRRPLVMPVGQAQAALQDLMHAIGVEHLIAVPLLAGSEFLGVATASWGAGAGPSTAADDLTLRLSGVADQAATALQGARLLSTVRHQATHDALTGLPNRVLFAERLEQALAAGTASAVLFCDLDRFKGVNDQLGHAAGDELLRQVAQRLTAALPAESVVGRLSGDEFAVLLIDVANPAATAHGLIACFEQPFRVEGHELRMTTSIGVACAQRGDLRPDGLLRVADTAMYVAKQQGRNQVSVAGSVAAPPGDQTQAGFEIELRRAIETDQLHLLYQPVVELAPGDTGRGDVVCVEALVRWDHPRLGLLVPGAFLSVAEESGLIVELDLWVLREATRALARSTAAGGPSRVAVNLSGRSLVDPRLHDRVLDALADSGLQPHQLELEVVESRALGDLPGIRGRLAALRRLGVHVALDDFGTGFSTLTWLQQLPADRVKLDRTFTTSLSDGAPGRCLVRGVLALARELGLEVVAEGVETLEQLTALRDEGCTLFQGYLLGRPAPLTALVVPAG